jgi:Ca2+/Na+ antiporter
MANERETNYFMNILGVFVIVLVVQAILFSYFEKIGMFFVSGIFIYFMFFIYRDRKMKKEELNKRLYHKKSWIGYDRKLPKEIA